MAGRMQHAALREQDVEPPRNPVAGSQSWIALSGISASGRRRGGTGGNREVAAGKLPVRAGITILQKS